MINRHPGGFGLLAIFEFRGGEVDVGTLPDGRGLARVLGRGGHTVDGGAAGRRRRYTTPVCCGPTTPPASNASTTCGEKSPPGRGSFVAKNPVRGFHDFHHEFFATLFQETAFADFNSTILQRLVDKTRHAGIVASPRRCSRLRLRADPVATVQFDLKSPRRSMLWDHWGFCRLLRVLEPLPPGSSEPSPGAL